MPTPENSIPSGYQKDIIWGKTYNGHVAYICAYEDQSKDPSVDYYMGWVNNEWVYLSCSQEYGVGSGNLQIRNTYTYKANGREVVYYVEEY